MAAMTEDGGRAFVAEGTRTAEPATVRPGGRPHGAPVGAVADDDGVAS